MICAACKRKCLVRLVHNNIAAAGYAACTHTARDNRRMRRHAAANREYALRMSHALNILGACLKTYKDNLFFPVGPLYRVLSREYDTAACSTRRSRQRCGNGLCVLESCRFKLRVQECVKLLRIYHHDGFLFSYHAFIDEVACYFERCGCRALTVTRLKHVKLLVFYGELHVLHISIVLFKLLADVYELRVGFRHNLCKLVYRLRCAYAGYDILALSVHKEFTEKLLFARCRVTRKCNARS